MTALVVTKEGKAEVANLIASHGGLIAWVIHRHRNELVSRLFDVDDAWQSGWIGLRSAAEAFDSARGVEFSTFAYPRIRRAIQVDRGRFDGINYRRALRPGQAHPAHQTPVSLDLPFSGEDIGADILPAPFSDPAPTAIASASLHDAARRGESHCRDAMDRRVVAGILSAKTLTAIAAEAGCTRRTAARRTRRLMPVMREAFR